MTMTTTKGPVPGDAGPIAVKARDLRLQERDGYAVMATVSAFGAATDHGSLSGAVHAAQLFCIFCACVLPVVALWMHTM